MKKLYTLFILFVLFAVQVQAAGIYLPVARGTVTQANMKISAVDGTAFVDFGYKYQSDFSAGVDSWAASQGTVDGNIDSIGGSDDWLRFTINTASSVHSMSRTGTFVVGKRYSVTLKYFLPSSNSNLTGAAIRFGGTTIANVSTTDTVVTVTGSFLAAITSAAFVMNYGATFQDSGGNDVFYIKDVKIEEFPLTNYIGNLLVIRDSSGRAIQGFIKAAGTGETEGDELATGTCTALKLYKITATESNHFGTGKVVGNYFTSAGTETLDANNKVKEISAPSSTGVTIVSTKGGSTFNFAQKNSSFNYSDASGYTYEIYKVLNAPVLDSDLCASANITLVTTNGSASWACAGIDDSVYQDGKHIIALYDNAGIAAFGYYKSAGSGAIVNAKSGSTQNFISIGSGFNVSGDITRKILYVGD